MYSKSIFCIFTYFCLHAQKAAKTEQSSHDNENIVLLVVVVVVTHVTPAVLTAHVSFLSALSFPDIRASSRLWIQIHSTIL